MKILTINAGSSSIKYKLFSMPSNKILSGGKIERIGEKDSKVKDHHQAVEMMFSSLLKDKRALKDIREIRGIGHRVVHGGEEFKYPVIIDKKVLKVIKKNCVLAPLHNPANLEGIKACMRLLPQVMQVAVFDTSFHQTMPSYAYLYALPFKYYQKYKIRKYGFHGTSHEYVSIQASRLLKKPLKKLNLITCHLGNGCSIAAIKNGRSIDTSMGFTPLEGLVMGTRCGDIDPALVVYLMEKEHLTSSQVYNILNKESGLLGISGISNDVRILVKNLKRNLRAKLSLDIFIYRIKKYIGAYLFILKKVDAIVFTAGIGENNRWMIDKIIEGWDQFLKYVPKVLVIPTDEEKMIAYHTYKLIKRAKQKEEKK